MTEEEQDRTIDRARCRAEVWKHSEPVGQCSRKATRVLTLRGTHVIVCVQHWHLAKKRGEWLFVIDSGPHIRADFVSAGAIR